MIKKAKVIVFILSLLPMVRLLWLGIGDELGANPVEFIVRSLGTWALVMLLVTLALTPLRMATGAAWLLQLKRMCGLYSFFYLCLHLLAYVGLDQWFDWQAIGKDIAKHPYILVGFSAFLLMLPLAITSSHFMMRRLKQRWKILHRLVYPIAVLGVIHFWWLVKQDVREPVWYACVLAVLLGARIFPRRTAAHQYRNKSGEQVNAAI